MMLDYPWTHPPRSQNKFEVDLVTSVPGENCAWGIFVSVLLAFAFLKGHWQFAEYVFMCVCSHASTCQLVVLKCTVHPLLCKPHTQFNCN